MNMNDPKDCPKRMEIPIRLLDMHQRQQAHRFSGPETEESMERKRQGDQITRAIALLKAHESMCECGAMPGDGNAALWDLGRSLAIHKDMHTAFQGTPKGEYHARSIREIEDALTILRNSMEAPKESPEWPDIIGAGPMMKKTSSLTFSEALDAVKRGKKVHRLHPFTPGWGVQENTLVVLGEDYIRVADMIATDWFIVEDGK